MATPIYELYEKEVVKNERLSKKYEKVKIELDSIKAENKQLQKKVDEIDEYIDRSIAKAVNKVIEHFEGKIKILEKQLEVKDAVGRISESKSVKVEKIDRTPPTLTIPGDITITADEVEEFDLMEGVIVSDNTDINNANDTIDVTTTGSLSALEGTYTITYTATDIAGNTTSKTRKITVEEHCSTIVLGKNITSGEIACKDPDRNPRYIGSNPNNYVKFNNELWRIIRVFDGQTKIIRNEAYRNNIEWDKNSSNGGHGSYGYNNWSISTLQVALNTTFLNSIDSTSKSLINQNYSWKLGGWEDSKITRDEMYKYHGQEQLGFYIQVIMDMPQVAQKNTVIQLIYLIGLPVVMLIVRIGTGYMILH